MKLGEDHSTGTILAAAAIFAVLSQPVYAQDSRGLQASLDFSEGLNYSDVDGTTILSSLGFGLTSRTRTQNLNFNIKGALEQDFDDGLSAKFVDPRLGLTYGIESRQTALNANLSYRQTDVDDFVGTDDDTLGVFVPDAGLREDISAGLGLTFGREAKFGGTVSLGYSEIVYSDTTRVSLVDSETMTAGANFRFEIDQRITTTLGYNRSETDRSSGRDVISQSLSAGAELAVTPTMNVNLSLGLNRIATTTGGVETVEDGLSYGLGLTQSRPAGSLRFNFNSDLAESGRRTSAVVGATRETRRGQLSGDIGLSESASGDIRPTVTLSYREDMPRGRYSVSINQKFDTRSDGDEVLNSRLRLNWRQDVTESLRLNSNLTYQVTDVLDADEDTARLALGFGFSQDLTEDWAVTTRYTHSFVEEDGQASTRENEIFVGLETSLGWRP